VPVVYDFVAHVDGWTVEGERPLDDIYRANDTGAEAPRSSQYYTYRCQVTGHTLS
jgi:hypothetical protein